MQKSVIFEKIGRVMLSRAITLDILDLDSKAGLPTNIHSFLLGFSFKVFWENQLIKIERQSDIVSRLGLGSA